MTHMVETVVQQNVALFGAGRCNKVWPFWGRPLQQSVAFWGAAEEHAKVHASTVVY